MKSYTLSPPQVKTAKQQQDNSPGVKVLLVDERFLEGAKTLGRYIWNDTKQSDMLNKRH